MRWLVLGAGALGGYFGGRLAQAGQDVTFLLRPRRMAQVRAAGIVIRSPRGDAHLAAPKCVAAGDITGAFEVVLLGCKAYDLDSAMDAIAPAVGPGSVILPLLNGMAHVDRLAARFGRERVLGGLCMISAALDADGGIRHFNDLHTLVYGELDGSRSARVRDIEAAFAPANCDAQASTAIVQEMWEKWVFIAALAGATCLLRAAIGDIARAGATDLMLAILEECSAIGAAHGHAPRPEARARMRAFMSQPDSTITASMLKDVESHARIEGEHIVGDLLARADPETPPRLLPIVHAHLRAYMARRGRELAAGGEAVRAP